MAKRFLGGVIHQIEEAHLHRFFSEHIPKTSIEVIHIVACLHHSYHPVDVIADPFSAIGLQPLVMVLAKMRIWIDLSQFTSYILIDSIVNKCHHIFAPS